MTIEIKAGKYYRTRDGRCVGPMQPHNSIFQAMSWLGPLGRDAIGYNSAGKPGYIQDTGLELIAEWNQTMPEPAPSPLTSLSYQVLGPIADLYAQTKELLRLMQNDVDDNNYTLLRHRAEKIVRRMDAIESLDKLRDSDDPSAARLFE